MHLFKHAAADDPTEDETFHLFLCSSYMTDHTEQGQCILDVDDHWTVHRVRLFWDRGWEQHCQHPMLGRPLPPGQADITPYFRVWLGMCTLRLVMSSDLAGTISDMRYSRFIYYLLAERRRCFVRVQVLLGGRCFTYTVERISNPWVSSSAESDAATYDFVDAMCAWELATFTLVPGFAEQLALA